MTLSWWLTDPAPYEAALACCKAADPARLGTLRTLYHDWSPIRLLDVLPLHSRHAVLEEPFDAGFSEADRSGVWVFGAGALGRWLTLTVERKGIPVLGFLDNDPSHQHRPVLGRPCVPPREAYEAGARRFIIGSLPHGPAMEAELMARFSGEAIVVHALHRLQIQSSTCERRLLQELAGPYRSVCQREENALDQFCLAARGSIWAMGLLGLHAHRLLLDQIQRKVFAEPAPRQSPFIYTLQ